MKRKELEYRKAIQLRKKGTSIKKIAKDLGVSVSIVSVWCRSIELTEEQIKHLRDRKVQVVHLRRLARDKKAKNKLRVAHILKMSQAEISLLNDQQLFITGLALYWAEGFKSIKEGRVGFCNSDPRMIKFIIEWFKRSLNVTPDKFTLRTEFNESHIDRLQTIQEFWSKLTNIPLSQFEKPYIHRSTWLKNYDNRENYHGVLRIRVRKSSETLLKIKGWINGLSQAHS